MKILKGLFFAVFMALVSMSAYAEKAVEVGAAQVKEYVPLLKGKRVAILSNHTGMVVISTLSTLCSKMASM